MFEVMFLYKFPAMYMGNTLYDTIIITKMYIHIIYIIIYIISIVDNESLFKMIYKIINEMSVFYNIVEASPTLS